ncbi:MAG: site-specific DNA-methyltransferase [Planctomycetes bacterium]|jgi:adenine-specific DNA-methyltransferase|nr:site-specific DNA-methyltransferase [Planctomycetota bacterium]
MRKEKRPAGAELPRLEFPGKLPEEEILRGDGRGRLPWAGASSRSALVLGDNLAALRCLLHDHGLAGKAGLVYIDPPFSTKAVFRTAEGRANSVSRPSAGAVAYDDRLSGSSYLEFLRERLVLLRELISASGSIYVHADTKIGHYAKALLDEVFGPGNFRADLTRVKCNPKNFARTGFGNVKDVILFYSRGADPVWNEPREPLDAEAIGRLFKKTDAQGRRYTTVPLHAPGETAGGATGKPWRGMNPPQGRHWRCDPKELDALDAAGRIEWSRNGVPRRILYADEAEKRGKRVQDVWEFKDPPYPSYPTEKNFEMLERIVAASSNPGDLVLDCFCGSGTALLAAQKLGRRWIGIDASPAAIEAAQKRLDAAPGPANGGYDLLTWEPGERS